MDYKIVMTEDIFDEIKESLEWDGRERMVYLLCHSSQHLDSIKIMPYKVIVPTEEDYVSRSVGHFVMRKGFASKVFIEALENQSHVIEFHEHPPEYPGMFSPVDNHHEPIIMRHVAEQISGMHLGAMVISHDFSELDAHFYDRELDDVVPVDKVIVVGKEDMKDEEIIDNIKTIYDQVIHHLPSERNNISSIYLKVTMGKPIKLM